MASYSAPISRAQPALRQGEKSRSLQPPGRPGFMSLPLRKTSSSSSSGGRAAAMVVASAASTPAAETPNKKRYPGEAKGFVEEMRFVAMRLHTRDQAKEGEKEADAQPIGKWQPSIEGYLRFLVDSKLVYDTLDSILAKAVYPSCESLFSMRPSFPFLFRDLSWTVPALSCLSSF